jgi:L-alanine-DL-glutamate epimerase-like enolase superfamily enzyme
MRITGIETIQLADTPFVLYVRIETDEGLVGHGDTFMMADGIAGYIHQRAAPKLLGKDAGQIQRHWSNLFDHDAARFGGMGIEVRAISALDVALWDLLGQSTGKPIFELLGGRVRDRIPVYNTCGGPAYGRPPYDVHGTPGELEDLWTWNNEPERLAHELLDEGITAMKFWPFDDYGIASDGLFISADELQAGLEPVRRIREAVGSRMKIMIDGHGFWRLPAAVKIARALEPYDIEWLEDALLGYDIGALGELKRSTSVPILASEYLVTRHQYLPLLQQRAADIVMLDPTWTGGITESHKIGALADTFGLPVTMHDCTGPFTLLAGVHLAYAAPNATYQEIVRAYIRTWYRDVVPHSVTIENGAILPPTEPGIGTFLLPDVAKRPDATVRRSAL